MSNLKKNRGIVLKKTKYSESDLIIQMIFSNGEKMSLLARSALKSKKRFGGGVLDPLHFIEVAYSETSADRMAVLNEALLIEDFPGLRSDYDRMEAALFCLSSISRVSQEGDEHSPALFNLLGHALHSLERVQNLSLFKSAFGLKLLYQQGVLEFEPWMSDYLKSSIQNLPEEEKNLELKAIHGQWIQNQIAHYLATASHQ